MSEPIGWLKYAAWLKTQAPVSISLKRATGHALETLPLIPGSCIRGALAAEFLNGDPSRAEKAAFRSLFLEGRVRFQDFRIANSQPWPLSVRKCADYPEDHVRRDLLLKAATGASIDLECTVPARGGKRCSAKRECPGGFYRAMEETFEEMEVATRRVAHTAIHPKFLRVESEQFYSVHAIAEEQVFEGAVLVRPEASTQLKDTFGGERSLYVGRGRTRGQGKVRLTLPAKADELDDPAPKVRGLNEEAARLFPETFGGKVVFSCTLLSPAILYDEWLMFRGEPDAFDISPQLTGYSPLAAFVQPWPVAGWNSGAGVPKAEATALAPGSSFLFGKEAKEDERQEEIGRLTERLKTVALEGIGERREEGFGEIALCEDIHWRIAEGGKG